MQLKTEQFELVGMTEHTLIIAPKVGEPTQPMEATIVHLGKLIEELRKMGYSLLCEIKNSCVSVPGEGAFIFERVRI